MFNYVKKMNYYLAFVGNHCRFQKGKSCNIWDSNIAEQRRPMGCHFYPMTWYWDDDQTVVFTKHCYPFLCKAESVRYNQADFNRDLNTFEKLCKEVELLGLTVNYRAVDAFKEQSYFTT